MGRKYLYTRDYFLIYQEPNKSWVIEVYDKNDQLVGDVQTFDLKAAFLAIQDVVTEKDLKEEVDADFKEN